MPKRLTSRLTASLMAAVTLTLVIAGCSNGAPPPPAPTSSPTIITLGVFKFKLVRYLRGQDDGDCADLSYGSNAKARACVISDDPKTRQVLSVNVPFDDPASIGAGFIKQAQQSGAKVDLPPLQDLKTPPGIAEAPQRPIDILKVKGDRVTVFRSTEGKQSTLTGVVVRHKGSGVVQSKEILLISINSDEAPDGAIHDAQQQRLMYGLLQSLKPVA